MKKIYAPLILLLSATAMQLHAQGFQGKAYYESKTNVEFNLDGREISEEQKKMIQERMRQAFEKTYILTFGPSESIYKEEERLQQPGAGGGRGFTMMAAGFSSGGYYKDIKQGIYYDQREMFGKNFLVKDTLNKLAWKLGKKKKKIGNYTCFKE